MHLISTTDNIPDLYTQEHALDPTVYVKLYTPHAYWTWYVTEFDGVDLFFSLCITDTEEEWGYTSLKELEEGSGVSLVVRDAEFKPKPLSKAKGRKCL